MKTLDFSSLRLAFVEKLNEQVSTTCLNSSSLDERFGRDKYLDYLKFQALLDYERKQSKPVPLQSTPSPSDQLILEIEDNIELDEEEENDPDDLTFLKDMSAFSSKKSSIFTLNQTSKKPSIFLPNNVRHQSLRSESGRKRDSLFPNFPANFKPKRSSALVEIQMKQEDEKKRNSAILEDISAKLTHQTQKTSSKRTFFENIKRGSLKCNLSLSSLKSSDRSSNYSQDDGKQNFNEDDDFSSESEISETQSDVSDDEADFEELKEEDYLKISFLKYENKRFKEWKPESGESTAKLRKMNLVDNFFEDSITNTPTKDQKNVVKTQPDKKFRKFRLPDKKMSKYQPYYLINQQGIINHRYRKYKNKKTNLCVLRKNASLKNKEETEEEKSALKEQLFEFGCIKPKQENELPSNDCYNFYLSQGATFNSCEGHQLSDSSLYTLSFFNQCLYSKKVPLKDHTVLPHFQIKIEYSKQELPWEKQVPLTDDDFGSIFGQNKLFNENYLNYIRDCGSKRGTFVKLGLNNPLMLQEGRLFLLNNKIGFYVKNEQHDVRPQENTIYEVLCINQKPCCEPIISLAIPGTEKASNKEKSPKGSPNKELKELLRSGKCPLIKLEIVRWNDKLEQYEEQGTIAFMYNNMTFIGGFDENVFPECNFIQKNWINIGEGSKVFSQLIKKLNLNLEILLVYDLEANIWGLKVAKNSKHASNIMQMELPFNWDQGYELTSKSLDIEQENLNQKIIENMNLLSPMEIKSEDNPLSGLWVCTSNFDILQEEFDRNWTKIKFPSLVMFGDLVFEMKKEKIHTLYE